MGFLMSVQLAANDSIDAFVRGTSVRKSSSSGLGWESIAVERHELGLADRSEIATSHHIVTLTSGLKVASGEFVWNGRHLRYTKPPGVMHLYLAGVVPAVYPSTQIDLIMCALDPVFVEGVSAEQESPFAIKLREQMNFYDGAVGSLIRLIEGEAKSGGASGRLYLDHLAFALTLRLLNFGTKNQDPHVSSNSLSHPRLKRVIERMQSDLDKDIDLRTLAIESGYSASHFLRMFRAATGFTPHRYLLQLRVARAQAMIKNKAVHLIDVALACGFSSHAQLSSVFRQIVGVTPSEYRRSI